MKRACLRRMIASAYLVRDQSPGTALLRSEIYGTSCSWNSASNPGVDKARTNFKSSAVLARQYSGMRKLTPGAPTLAGQLTLPTG